MAFGKSNAIKKEPNYLFNLSGDNFSFSISNTAGMHGRLSYTFSPPARSVLVHYDINLTVINREEPSSSLKFYTAQSTIFEHHFANDPPDSTPYFVQKGEFEIADTNEEQYIKLYNNWGTIHSLDPDYFAGWIRIWITDKTVD